MELKTTKVYVPTDAKSILKVKCAEDDEGNSMSCNVLLKEGFFITKEELERVIGDAFEMGEKKTKLPITTPNKQDYINQTIK